MINIGFVYYKRVSLTEFHASNCISDFLLFFLNKMNCDRFTYSTGMVLLSYKVQQGAVN